MSSNRVISNETNKRTSYSIVDLFSGSHPHTRNLIRVEKDDMNYDVDSLFDFCFLRLMCFKSSMKGKI